MDLFSFYKQPLQIRLKQHRTLTQFIMSNALVIILFRITFINFIFNPPFMQVHPLLWIPKKKWNPTPSLLWSKDPVCLCCFFGDVTMDIPTHDRLLCVCMENIDPTDRLFSARPGGRRGIDHDKKCIHTMLTPPPPEVRPFHALINCIHLKTLNK